MEDFANYMEIQRELVGITATKLADLISISVVYMRDLEKGKRYPTPETLKRWYSELKRLGEEKDPDGKMKICHKSLADVLELCIQDRVSFVVDTSSWTDAQLRQLAELVATAPN